MNSRRMYWIQRYQHTAAPLFRFQNLFRRMTTWVVFFIAIPMEKKFDRKRAHRGHVLLFDKTNEAPSCLVVGRYQANGLEICIFFSCMPGSETREEWLWSFRLSLTTPNWRWAKAIRIWLVLVLGRGWCLCTLTNDGAGNYINPRGRVEIDVGRDQFSLLLFCLFLAPPPSPVHNTRKISLAPSV